MLLCHSGWSWEVPEHPASQGHLRVCAEGTGPLPLPQSCPQPPVPTVPYSACAPPETARHRDRQARPRIRGQAPPPPGEADRAGPWWTHRAVAAVESGTGGSLIKALVTAAFPSLKELELCSHPGHSPQPDPPGWAQSPQPPSDPQPGHLLHPHQPWFFPSQLQMISRPTSHLPAALLPPRNAVPAIFTRAAPA